MHCRGDHVLVGDLMRSVSVYLYKAQPEPQLELRAQVRDNAHWTGPRCASTLWSRRPLSPHPQRQCRSSSPARTSSGVWEGFLASSAKP